MSDEIRPGWYTDPTGEHDRRYWDGERWTDRIADGSTPAWGTAGETDATAANPTADATTETPAATTGTAPPMAPIDYAGAGTPPPPPPAWSTGASSFPPAPPPGPPPRRGLSNGATVALVIGLIGIPVAIIAAILLLGNGDDDDDGASDTTVVTSDATTDNEDAASDEFLVESIAEGIRSTAPDAVTQEQAECVAQGFLDELGRDRVFELGLGALESGDPEAFGQSLPPETQQQVASIMLDCLPPEVIEAIVEEQGGTTN
jgi:hypothetical protein